MGNACWRCLPRRACVGTSAARLMGLGVVGLSASPVSDKSRLRSLSEAHLGLGEARGRELGIPAWQVFEKACVSRILALFCLILQHG